MSIDCYEIYEDTKDIYLIQNKYYNDNTKITAEYVKNDFLLRGINALKMVHINDQVNYKKLLLD